MEKKIVGIFLSMLLLVSALPIVSGNMIEKEPTEMYETIFSDILFFDDFNDNNKDLNNWTEIFNSGTWEEVNGRTEFTLQESGGSGSRSEGIGSTTIQAMIGGDEPWENKLTLTWIMYPDIGSTSREGKVTLRITDGRNWIEAGYDCGSGVARFSDSKGNGDEWIGGDEPWENKLDIFVDKYDVTMNTNSGTVHDSIFKDGISTFNVQIYIELAGSSRDLYQQSAFDDIMVEGVAGCCFPAHTKITMADGSCKNIEDVKVGDRVLSYDIKNGKYTSWMVKMLGRPLHPVYEINDGLISATVDHPFFIKKSGDIVGWGAINIKKAKKFITIKEDILQLEVGDQLFTSNGEWIEVTSIMLNAELVQTYNILSFSGTRTYFANGILVYEEHPPCCTTSYLLEILCERFPNAFLMIRQLIQRLGL